MTVRKTILLRKSLQPQPAQAPGSLIGTVLSFAGLVALAKWPDPIPSRTRPSNASAPMVLCLKTWESRSSPGLQKTKRNKSSSQTQPTTGGPIGRRSRVRPHVSILPIEPMDRQTQTRYPFDAGWSSPVARQAHNLKVTGSNPVPATKFK